MICVNLTLPQTITAGSTILFDNVVCATNDAIELKDGALLFRQPGWYTLNLNAVLSSTSAVSDSIYMCNDGNMIEGTEIDIDVAANGIEAMSLEFPIHVVPAPGQDVVTITYESTMGITVDTATLVVKRVV